MTTDDGAAPQLHQHVSAREFRITLDFLGELKAW